MPLLAKEEGRWTLTWINNYSSEVRQKNNKCGGADSVAGTVILGRDDLRPAASRTATDKESRAKLPNNDPWCKRAFEMGTAMLKTIIAFAIAFACSENSVAQEIWGRYCNARFGQCADVPRSYKSDPPPANGDGLIFRDGKGMVVVISAMYNVSDSSLTDEKNATLNDLPKPTYQAEKDNWFIVSGIRDGKIFYIKKFVTADHISTLWIEYPEANKELYDATLSRLSKSFTPAHN